MALYTSTEQLRVFYLKQMKHILNLFRWFVGCLLLNPEEPPEGFSWESGKRYPWRRFHSFRERASLKKIIAEIHKKR